MAQKEYQKKNIYNISGHPLLSYSLQAAKESRFINKIIVSTDSLTIAKTDNQMKCDYD